MRSPSRLNSLAAIFLATSGAEELTGTSHPTATASAPPARTGISHLDSLYPSADLPANLEHFRAPPPRQPDPNAVQCQITINLREEPVFKTVLTTPSCCSGINEFLHTWSSSDGLCIPANAKGQPCWKDLDQEIFLLMDFKLIEKGKASDRPLRSFKKSMDQSLKRRLEEECPTGVTLAKTAPRDSHQLDGLAPSGNPKAATLIDKVALLAEDDPSAGYFLYTRYKALIEGMRKERLQQLEIKRAVILFALIQCVVCVLACAYIIRKDVSRLLSKANQCTIDYIWQLIQSHVICVDQSNHYEPVSNIVTPMGLPEQYSPKLRSKMSKLKSKKSRCKSTLAQKARSMAASAPLTRQMGSLEDDPSASSDGGRVCKFFISDLIELEREGALEAGCHRSLPVAIYSSDESIVDPLSSPMTPGTPRPSSRSPLLTSTSRARGYGQRFIY